MILKWKSSDRLSFKSFFFFFLFKRFVFVSSSSKWKSIINHSTKLFSKRSSASPFLSPFSLIAHRINISVVSCYSFLRCQHMAIHRVSRSRTSKNFQSFFSNRSSLDRRSNRHASFKSLHFSWTFFSLPSSLSTNETLSSLSKERSDTQTDSQNMEHLSKHYLSLRILLYDTSPSTIFSSTIKHSREKNSTLPSSSPSPPFLDTNLSPFSS